MKTLILVLLPFLLFSLGCKKVKEGCTDPVATNYNSEANSDDGSCDYIYGCMDNSAYNYNSNATIDDGSCTYPATPGNIIFYLVLYPSADYGSGVDIWLNYGEPDSIYLGKAAMVPQSVPGCESAWGIKFSDTTYSNYTYHCVLDDTPSRVWNGSFTLTEGNCQRVALSTE